MKYKNKNGIQLNFDGMSKEGRDGSGVTLIQEIVRVAINLIDEDKEKAKKFLEENFSVVD